MSAARAGGAGAGGGSNGGGVWVPGSNTPATSPSPMSGEPGMRVSSHTSSGIGSIVSRIFDAAVAAGNIFQRPHTHAHAQADGALPTSMTGGGAAAPPTSAAGGVKDDAAPSYESLVTRRLIVPRGAPSAASSSSSSSSSADRPPSAGSDASASDGQCLPGLGGDGLKLQ